MIPLNVILVSDKLKNPPSSLRNFEVAYMLAICRVQELWVI